MGDFGEEPVPEGVVTRRQVLKGAGAIGVAAAAMAAGVSPSGASPTAPTAVSPAFVPRTASGATELSRHHR